MHGISVPRMQLALLVGLLPFMLEVSEVPLLLHQCAARTEACGAKVRTATALGPDPIRFTYIASSSTLHNDWHKQQCAQCRVDNVRGDIACTQSTSVDASWDCCLIVTEGNIAYDSPLPHHGQILRIDHAWAHTGQRPKSTALIAAAAYPSRPIHARWIYPLLFNTSTPHYRQLCDITMTLHPKRPLFHACPL